MQVMYCLEALAEQQGVMRQQMQEIGQILDGITNTINDLAGALGVMRDFVEDTKSASERLQHMEHDDDGSPVTE